MRKEALVTISTPGRDQGKVFTIREMPAMKVEKWATRAFLAMAKSGLEVPDDVSKSGVAGIASMGIRSIALLSFEDAEPLLDEMMTCVKFMPNPSQPLVVRNLIDDDIEEVATLLQIRKEVFQLHTGFSFPAAPSISEAASGEQATLNLSPT